MDENASRWLELLSEQSKHLQTSANTICWLLAAIAGSLIALVWRMW